jgi:hypothetical protein
MTAMLERTSSMTSAEALRATGALLREHGLVGWRVGFGHAKRTAGTCDHRMKVITLSKYLLAQRSYEDSMMTITHEVAGRGSTAPSEATASVSSSTPTAGSGWKRARSRSPTSSQRKRFDT